MRLAISNTHWYLKSAVTRGGFISDIYAQELTVATVSQFLYLTGHYVSGPVIGTPVYTTVSNINVDGSRDHRQDDEIAVPRGRSGRHQTRNRGQLEQHHGNGLARARAGYRVWPHRGLSTTNVEVNGVAFNPPASAP